MNARIKQLIDQSTTCKWRGDGTDSIPKVEFDKERFAELLIKECAMYIVLSLEAKVGSAIADATANGLEEYFGVK